LGQREEIAALVSKLRSSEKFARFQNIIHREEERAKTIKARLTRNSEPSTTPMTQFEMRAELTRDRLLRDYRAHPSAERQRILRAAMDAGDLDYLNVLVSEPGLVPVEMARRIDAMRMQAIDPKAATELFDLLGPLDYAGEHQGERGALTVARQHFVELERWLRAQAEGEYRASLAELLQERGLAPAQVSDEAILLTREQAKDAQVFKTARAEAEAAGKEPRVESPEGNGAA
jgi:hypothetical protein